MKCTGAALNRTALLLLLAAFPLFPLIAQTTTKPAKKKTTAVAATRRTTAKSTKPAAATTLHSRRTVSAKQSSATGTARVKARRVVVTRKLVHGRWVRTTQIVRAAPQPTYQTHPDPERYTQIQQALASSGYFKGEANGQWGDDSVDALKRFQADHKLPNDGKISSLSLIDLGLGPNHGGSTPAPPPPSASAAPAVPAPSVPAQADPVHN